MCCYYFPSLLLLGQGSELEEKYETALNYFYTEFPTDQSDSTAIQLLEEIKAQIPTDALPLSQSADVFDKLGTLYLIQGKPENSIDVLRQGLTFISRNNLNDTLKFSPALYLGESFFLLNQADSSILYLNQAEEILKKKTNKQETGRLYNSLGVIYYESGNYTQAINYFSKARSIITQKAKPGPASAARYAVFSFQTNEAAAWANLKEFDKAEALYLEALSLNIDKDEIFSKLASLSIKSQKPDSALYYLNSITDPTNKQSLPNQNLRAEIHLLNMEPDKALKLIVSNFEEKDNYQTKPAALNYHLGKSYQLLGKSWLLKEEYQKAAEGFHKAILNFDGSFTETDIRKNPSPGNINWGMTDIFESLSLKAKSLLALAKEKEKDQLFQLAFDTYQVAFDLLFYLNNLYDNQEARIFLGESIRKAYEDAVSASIDLYLATNDEAHLIRGFLWAEESKATALELARNEGKIKENADIPQELLQKEKVLKFQLTRANQKIREVQDPDIVDDLEIQVRDSKLALSRLYASYNGFSSYFEKKINTERININSLQANLKAGRQVLLSYFVANDTVFCFVLNKDRLYLSEIIEKDSLFNLIRSINKELVTSKGNSRRTLEDISVRAFDQMLGQSYSDLENYSNWVILPDQELVHLPFEMLVNPKGEHLVKNHSITYQYSGKLLQLDSFGNRFNKNSAIGFAPFTAIDSLLESSEFDLLPNAASEMELLEGRVFLGNAATKQQFLEHSTNASIIHLATHALSTPDSPDEGFIVFSTAGENHLLFAEELYQLNLQNASLVFLSACDTHKGEVVNGEGLISLSRGFAYAGCDNIISSIWKANDKVTAYLSRVFYKKLNMGYSYPEALQGAKKELLNDPDMAQYHHPYYWANMVFIGNTFEDTFIQAKFSVFWFMILVVMATSLIYYWKKKRVDPTLF
ncbi:CHAT domain-containing protein [Cyclobacterium plantarum]|uniref:CHAT domain-containing protein n=1 Tax=Cyclobacterium plantarum TaxID=2716263 RepID=UPI003F7052BC